MLFICSSSSVLDMTLKNQRSVKMYTCSKSCSAHAHSLMKSDQISSCKQQDSYIYSCMYESFSSVPESYTAAAMLTTIVCNQTLFTRSPYDLSEHDASLSKEL